MSERDLFAATLQITDPAQRAAWLDRACAGDPALRQRVEVLLQALGQAGSLLDNPPFAPQATAGPAESPPAGGRDDRPAAERPGAVVGPYKLLQELGEGGMGVVFLAEQTRPVQRKVALKFIKSGMDSRQVMARFDAERQALALMDHPHIARVLDAGATAVGRPYFVMELVKGVPITRYCDEHRLTPRQRLELFVPVCQAVQHAHQKGIIHRDLKPSNVLVAPYDGRPVPKVIDFGVAKAAGPRLTERTLFTEVGQVVGTLEYMSPEQAELNQLDVDTRSDVYSLGVLLYELLTGTTPLQRGRLKEAAFLEVLRLIREEDAPRPSTRLSTAEGLPSIAANRGLEPRKLSGLVRGELDWIVMKALEKDRNRRYESPNGLAQDIERYLHDEAVQACPPSAAYRFGKFARRNRSTLAVAAALLSVMVLGAFLSGWQAVRATGAEKRAEDGWAAETAARTEAEAARGQAVANLKKAREAVDRMLSRIGEYDIARLLPQMAKFQRKLLEDALEFNKGFLEVDQKDPDLKLEAARAHLRIGRMYQVFDEYEASEKACAACVAILTSLVTEYPDDLRFQGELVRAYIDLGYALKREPSELRKHEDTRRRGAALADALAGKKPQEREPRVLQIESHCCLGETLLWFNKAADAEPELALALAQKIDDWYFIGRCAQFLGEASRALGQLDAAERYLGMALDNLHKSGLDTSVHGTRNVAQIRISLSDVLARKGRGVEAETQLARALELFTGLSRDYPDSIYLFECAALCAGRLGDLLKARTRRDEARAAYRRALDAHFRLVSARPNDAHRHEALRQCFASLDALLIESKRAAERKEIRADVIALYRSLLEKAPTDVLRQALRRFDLGK